MKPFYLDWFYQCWGVVMLVCSSFWQVLIFFYFFEYMRPLFLNTRSSESVLWICFCSLSVSPFAKWNLRNPDMILFHGFVDFRGNFFALSYLQYKCFMKTFVSHIILISVVIAVITQHLIFLSEAFSLRCPSRKVFCKYASNLLENTLYATAFYCI